MGYRQLQIDPAPTAVTRVTFVLFLADGYCAAIPTPAGPALPSDSVHVGEHYLLDSSLRIPLEQAGYRYQRVRPFAADAGHVYAWLVGDRYRGRRPHRAVDLLTGTPEQIIAALAHAGRPGQARAVRHAARLFRSQNDAAEQADLIGLVGLAYRRAPTPEGGSGFGGSPEQWRDRRHSLVDGIDADGTLLDLGCANGLLMESVQQWGAERGHAIEPYGLDVTPTIVDLARHRLPHWAHRIWAGDALTFQPPDHLRFRYVHLLLEQFPTNRLLQVLHRAAGTFAEPGGRILVSHYLASENDPGTAARLAALGIAVDGETTDRRASWIDVPDPAKPTRPPKQKENTSATPPSRNHAPTGQGS